MKPLQSHSGLLQFLLATTLHLDSSRASPFTWEPEPDQQLLNKHTGSRAGVASEAKECSQIGGHILSQGGNAVDAAIATTFCVGVGAPYHSGIGGGGFMLVRDKHGNYEAIDFRETAPAAADEDMYKDNVHGSVVGGLSVAVPGEVRGLWYAHQKYGQLPWKELLKGAHDRALGFTMNRDYMRYINKAIHASHGNFILNDPSWAEDYVKDGRILEEGQLVVRERYANVLKTLAEKGADAFYEGPIAEAMIASIQARNGTMTLEDLKNYKVKARPVLTSTYRGYKLHTMGAPASGSIALNILNVMDGYTEPQNLYDDDVNEERDNLWHKYVEAMKFGYAARGKLGDPDFVENLDEYEAAIIDKKSAKKIRNMIDPKHTQNVTAYNPDKVYQPDNHGTSHIVTADDEGMAVTLTTTVNLLFGSLIMCNVTGIVLNNEMNDFSIPGVRNEFGFEPSESNFIRPGKRPLSSITPIIIERPDGTFFAAAGAAGGSRILSATTQVVWRIMSEPMSIVDAVDEPRLHHQLMPNTLLAEQGFPVTSARELENKYGHNVTRVGPGLSIVEGVTRDENGVFEAAADKRQTNHGAVTV
ncbi:gamma-glutamyltranspeptidase [Mariannaea sp. PMI_226]|nr:gamma-glutamyltranspeptidase [Mariannaea sp. PMI_226]